MFPLRWNFPFRKKDGNMVNLEDVTGDVSGLTERVADIEDEVDGLAESKVSWNNFSELGSVNILENDATTQTVSGVTFTRNADGSITCSGTATANITYNIKTQPKMEEGKQYLLKSFQEDSSENAYLSYSDIQSEDFGDYDGNGVIITKFDYSSYPNSKVRLRILNGTTFETPMTFYPLITPILDYSGPYAPHAMTNRELTENVAIKSSEISVNTDNLDSENISRNYVNKSAGVKLLVLQAKPKINLVAGTTYELGAIPSDYLPAISTGFIKEDVVNSAGSTALIEVSSGKLKLTPRVNNLSTSSSFIVSLVYI